MALVVDSFEQVENFLRGFGRICEKGKLGVGVEKKQHFVGENETCCISDRG